IEHAGGGCILDMGYHIIDQLVWWFGLPDNIFAQKSTLAVPNANYDAEDTATIAFKYESGLHGSILLSRFAGDKQEEYSLYGSNGSIVGSKKHLLVKNRAGEIICEEAEQDTSVMIDSQLEFFITRIRQDINFSDIHDENLMNMRFIDRCYSRSRFAEKLDYNYSTLLGQKHV
ncbi:MAG: Gfo/Idh/MocA family oxidoreductase, partial [bacterium]|nr:Gfo/Idh/MocA family oxidoreductase [bacterium]